MPARPRHANVHPGPRAACAAIALAAASALACGASTRDAVPESRDVVVDGGAPTRSAEGYEYVAKRRGAVVALAEARGVAQPVARAAIDRLADGLVRCVADASQGHAPARGAARVIAQLGPDGAVSGVNLRVDPGTNVTPVAVMCLVAPVKLLTFPPADPSIARGLAIEALWGEPASASAPPDPPTAP